MAKTPLRIATGARTPLYLPIYLLRRHKGFQLQTYYSISLSVPEHGNTNGDSWAARQLMDGKADFAVCDPTLAEANRSLCAVATIVDRMAFWAVARKDIGFLEEFGEFKSLISYPIGMTGYFVAKMIRERVAKKLKLSAKKKPEIIPVAPNSELEILMKTTDAVALTTNLLLAKSFTDDNPTFKLSALWPLDPAFSSFMLTGLLARQQEINHHTPLVNHIVRGLHRAVALVHTDSDEAVQGLKSEYDKLSDDDAQYFVREATEKLLFPTVLTPNLASWDNVRIVHNEGSESEPDLSWIKRGIPSIRTFEGAVNTAFALEADRLSLSVLVRFGKGELYEDLAKALDVDRISLQNAIVIGFYRRFEPDNRNFLIEKVEQIKKAVLTLSKTNENYLIWGTSGSGKSFLIEELGRTLELNGSCRFEPLDFSDLTPEKVQEKIGELESETRPILCLFDEIDNISDYRPLFSKLRWRKKKKKQIVFVLVGSTMNSVGELADRLRSGEKGKDLVRAIRKGNSFEVPDYTMWDRLIIFMGGAAKSAEEERRRLVRVEKLALYWVAVNTSNEPAVAATLSELGESAAKRMLQRSGEDTLRYDDLFDINTGEQERFTFYSEHISTATRLVGRYVQLD